MSVFAILCMLLLFLVIYFLYKDHQDRQLFESKGIPYAGNGVLRIFLNIFYKVGFNEDVLLQYQKMKERNVKLSGTNDFGLTSLLVTDPDILRHIFVKDFDHFQDRREFKISKRDYLFSKMLFALRGEKWKLLRSKLSPTFTTGKIKRVFPLFKTSGQKFLKFMEAEVNSAPEGEVDISEAYSKYTMDVIGSVAFGVDSKAFDQKEPSLFEVMARNMQFKFGGTQLLKFIVMVTSPMIGNLFGFSFFSEDVQEFFTKAVKMSIDHRVKTKEKRDDFIQLMMEAREGSLKTDESELESFEKDAELKVSKDEMVKASDLLDDDGIAANCTLFMLGGFDTTQSLLLFCAYCLALNQDVQDRLRAEIEGVLDENDGELTYEGLNKMTYLDMIIHETLRFYPPAAATDRGCTMDYKIPGTEFVLKKGQGIIVPIFGLHHDEQYFPNPEKFDPERFSPENKPKINQYVYLPFGQGPRNCIGMRFALTEVKVVIANLVHSFKIEPSKKTLIPMKFAKVNSLKPEGGMWLAFKKIPH